MVNVSSSLNLLFSTVQVHMKRIAACFLLLVLALPALAQEAALQPTQGVPRDLAPSEETASKSDGADEAERVIHVTDRLNGTPEAQEALRAFQAAKAAGRLPLAGKGTAYQLADSANFNVLVNISADSIRWESQRFALKATSDIANIWVEAGQLREENVTEDQINALEDALLNNTPDGSINSSRGIIANDNAIFGDPPNYDGDGKVDVLLYDITEGVEEQDGCCVLGYVVGTDINPRAAPGDGNQRDVLYLDTKPGSGSISLGTLLSTAAHEYQHLIHFNYDLNEETFVNEGLSEWAEVINGYTARTTSYLGNEDELNTELFMWRRTEPIRVLSNDYQRAGLLTNYIAERIGNEKAGTITQSAANGEAGYNAVLVPEGLSLAEIITDFHTANYLNDRSIDPRFGYTTPQYSQVRAVRTGIVDGRTSGSPSTPVTQGSVNPGAVQYLIWEQVSDFELDFDVDAPAQELTTLRAVLRSRVVLNRGGTITVQDIDPRDDPYAFGGDYDRITVIIPHIDPEREGLLPFTYSSSWSEQVQFESETTQYDDGAVAQDENGAIEAYSFGEGFRYANRFDVPEEGVLKSVAVAPYYRNRFNSYPEVPNDAPRNFALKVWRAAADGTPGQELFSTVVEDARFNDVPELAFLEIDLSEFADEISDFPSTIFIGIEDTGMDENLLAPAVTEYDGDNVSYLFVPSSASNNPGWRAFPDIEFQSGGFLLRERVLPIRATFLTPAIVAVDGGEELPERVELAPNYPNPFNPATTLAYRLPQTSAVRLEVYDVLGRRVATLLDGVTQEAGSHTFTLNASGWASGLYFYTLEAANQRLTRTMMLVK